MTADQQELLFAAYRLSERGASQSWPANRQKYANEKLLLSGTELRKV